MIQQNREGGEFARHRTSLSSFLEKTNDPLKANFKVAELKRQIIGFGKTQYLMPPEDTPDNCIPEGWYLSGLIVEPNFRRQGVGLELTKTRLRWLFEKTDYVYYFANSVNQASIILHKKLGFEEISKNIWAPKLSPDGVHILYRLDLHPASKSVE